jgi:hypothetical protein
VRSQRHYCLDYISIAGDDDRVEDRDADRVEGVLREPSLGLAAPVEKNVTYLDEGQLSSELTQKRECWGLSRKKRKGERDG